MVRGVLAESEGAEAVLRELLVQEAADGGVAVDGGGVVQDDLHLAGGGRSAQEDAGGVAVAGDQEAEIRLGVGAGELGQPLPDVLQVPVDQEGQIRVVPAGPDQVVLLLLLHQTVQMINVDAREAEIHDRRGVRLNQQGVDGKDDAADQVDDPQAYDGRHQHGDQHQSGAEIADEFNNDFGIHEMNPPLSEGLFFMENEKGAPVALPAES